MATRKKCSTDINLLIENGALEMLKKRRVQWPKLYNKTDLTGYGLLATAIRSHSCKMVEYLLDKGFDIEFKNKFSGYTPIIYAATNMTRILGLLIVRGANIHATNNRGETALHVAVANGYLENVIILLEKGSTLESVDQEGNTPLHLACKFYQLDIIKWLIDKGASHRVKNKVGQTPLDLAKNTWKSQEIMLYLKK
jgi:ankyrin repeat protein